MDAGIITTQLTAVSQPTAAVAKNASAGADNVRTAARKAAEEFESVFLTTLLESMFAGIKTDGPTGGGNSEKTYRSMMLGEYAKEMASNGGLGIADHVYREILAAQENAQR